MPDKDYLDASYSPTRKPVPHYPVLLAKWLLDHVYYRTGKLLDVGCGRGDNLQAFASIGFEVAGVDMSPRAPELIPEYPIIVVDLGADTSVIPPASYDFIFSKSVIEHLRRPDKCFEKCWQALKPGGVAVIMTPSWRHVYRTFFDAYTHVTPFTATSLHAALEINGFVDIEVSLFWQLPFLWRMPRLFPIVYLVARLPIPYRPVNEVQWPDSVNKFIRFSKEVMLLGVGHRPAQAEDVNAGVIETCPKCGEIEVAIIY